MRKVMNFKFMTIEEMEVNQINSWVSEEVEYDLVYDNEGDLYGVLIDNLDDDVIEDLERGFHNGCYDFPGTISEYNGEEE